MCAPVGRSFGEEGRGGNGGTTPLIDKLFSFSPPSAVGRIFGKEGRKGRGCYLLLLVVVVVVVVVVVFGGGAYR